MVSVRSRATRPHDAGAAPFCVLLGPDHAGKSTVMERLRGSGAPWRLLSVDDRFLGPEHALIGRLRREVVGEVTGADGVWSPDFLTTMVQTAVVHLRDQLLHGDPSRPAVVDSYYYKLLAKCRLAGALDHPMFDWWRSFPRPRRVIYLDVRPESAWQRCGHGRNLNALEYYGERPERDGFELYQRDLAKTMWDEIRDLPVTVIGEEHGPARTTEEIRKVLTDEFD
ncbi:hypothetical protein [Streptomyces aurantiogriseus]|uniref:Thymidylate kinase n=1 Tax=Streptomyces aurantiogriseus TaxID=66870 RepID=A0A918C1M5_9ACTN|nr:hypothetical protein [Streptomyces aurantiogriseus]GGR02634.1 hypothetical protein GCM10010251_18050 [Streptomyces aurantiogriseus]